MSRTYRRKKDRKGRNCEAGFWQEEVFCTEESWWVYLKYNGSIKKARAKYHADNHSGYYSPPSWFFKEYCTKPERQATRTALKQVMKLEDYEDYPLFPLDKKPKEYYW